ncbi:hypothetical protein PR048_002486 [Dryococelus australis]|uniref:RNA-directed DNA polymerase n=1 Tax=Dryococelus australis TaxID=614101 RepID=A0ABQ9IKA4_9NEOP|nr:hypothetical protein PR048_002486 [Dryococelus australis]
MCKFGTIRDDLIKDPIMCGIRDNTLRLRFLREHNLALIQAIESCRTAKVTGKLLEMFQAEAAAIQEVVTCSNVLLRNSGLQNNDTTRLRTDQWHFHSDRCATIPKHRKCPAYGAKKVETVQSNAQDSNLKALIPMYPQCFKGIGILPGDYRMILREDANPIIHAPRRDAAALRESLRVIHPDATEVDAIHCMDVPTCKKDIERFLGVIAHLSKFLPNLPDARAPLRVCSVMVNFKVTDAKLLMLQQYMERDHELQSLCRIIKVGWPENLQKVPPELKHYRTYRENLSYAYGLVLKGKAIVGPKGLQPEILRSIYAVHQGQEKCIQRARGTVFWPSMAPGISALVENCEVYKEFQESKYRQTLLPHPVPYRPRQKTVKKTLKVTQDQNYANIAFHELRNTPVKQRHSPAQLLMGCCLRDCIPIVPALLNPSLPNHKEVHAALLAKQTDQKAYYDVRAHQPEEKPNYWSSQDADI